MGHSERLWWNTDICSLQWNTVYFAWATRVKQNLKKKKIQCLLYEYFLLCVEIIWYHGDGKTIWRLEREVWKRYSGVGVFPSPLPSCSQTPCLRNRDPVGNCPGSASGSNAQPGQFTHCKERYLARDTSSHLWAQMALLSPCSSQERLACLSGKKTQSLPLAISSSSSWSNPCRWHFLQSPILVELYCLLHSSTALIAKICLLFLAKRSFPSQRSNLDLLALRGRLLLEL